MNKDSKLICTWGEHGAAGISGKNGTEIFVPAIFVEKIVDTCGAGDTFTASVIASLMKKNCLKKAMETGCKIAAEKIKQRGFKNLRRHWIKTD